MPENESEIPEEAKNFKVDSGADQIENREVELGKERIEGTIWRPGILDEHKDAVAAAASTKQTKRTPENALRLLGKKDRFEQPLGDRIKTGRILAELRDVVDPDADLHHVIKTGLVYGGRVAKIDQEYVKDLEKGNLPNKQIAETDGMVTNLPGYPLYVSAADCNPVGLYDPKTKSMGLFHGGFWGTLNGISGNTVEALAKEYGANPQDIVVTVGPGISQDGYEIDEKAMDYAKKNMGEAAETFAVKIPETGKYKFDVAGATIHRLIEAGVKPENIERSQFTTDKNNDMFPSARLEGDKDRDNFGFMMVLK